MTEPQTPSDRIARFLDARDTWNATLKRHTPYIQKFPHPAINSTNLAELLPEDLRALLAERDQLAAAIERTTAKMREYAAHGSGTVNVHQVIGLLSPTWPDGNYVSMPPANCRRCERPFDPTDTRTAGHAQHHDTPFCRSCVDLCHDNDIADHRCMICTPDLNP